MDNNKVREDLTEDLSQLFAEVFRDLEVADFNESEAAWVAAFRGEPCA